MGFRPTLHDCHGRIARTAFDRRRLFCVLRRTPAGLYPARRWRMEAHVRHGNTPGRPAGIHHFNSRWAPRASPPRRAAGAAWRHPPPSSGPAYGVRKTAGLARTPERHRRSGDGPCTGSIFGSDAVQETSRATHIYLYTTIHQIWRRPFECPMQHGNNSISESLPASRLMMLSGGC